MRAICICSGAVLAWAIAAAASAGDLFSANIQVPLTGARVFCQANNVGKKAGPVTVTIYNTDTGMVETTAACADIQPIHACLASTQGALSGGADAYCGVHTSLKVRAVIKTQSLADDSIIQALPLTK